MAITDLSNEELVDAFAAAFTMESYSDSKLARAELLRRLSAGNPQAKKVQITHDCALEMTPADMRLALAGMTAERRWIVMGGFCSECGVDLAHRGTIGRLAHYAGHDPNPEPERSDGRISTPLGPMTMAECVREGERSDGRTASCGEPHCEDGWHMIPDVGATPCPNASDAATTEAYGGPSGEQRETRIQGEEWPHTPGLARGLTLPEAQRSAGRD